MILHSTLSKTHTILIKCGKLFSVRLTVLYSFVSQYIKGIRSCAFIIHLKRISPKSGQYIHCTAPGFAEYSHQYMFRSHKLCSHRFRRTHCAFKNPSQRRSHIGKGKRCFFAFSHHYRNLIV